MYKFLLPLFALALLVGCTSGDDTTGTQTDNYGTDSSTQNTQTPPTPTSTDNTTPEPMASGYNGPLLTGMHTVVLHTSMGDVTVELDADKAPKTVTNFVMHSKDGYYDNLTFHRVIPGFMIQGGDPSGNGTGGESIYGPEFEDESNDMLMERGVLAMANRGPNTNGSQFFVVTAPQGTPWLQGRHTIFGRVTAGMEVVDAISTVERDGMDKPITAVTFTPEVK
jgi:cyclophilin family peptidyl-prolyl cis-trans isomerase